LTELDWLDTPDPESLSRADDRKVRLLACAWGFAVWPRMPRDECREAVLVAERYADGAADRGELHQAFLAADGAWKAVPDAVHRRYGRGDRQIRGYRSAKRAARVARNAADPGLMWDTLLRGWWWENGATKYLLTGYLRDLLGHPSRSAVIDPRWRTSAVTGLAAVVYEEKAFDRLPILADALQEAGCEDQEILGHCRGEGPHARGCWALDSVLGKE
jgi:hypothetical protein